MERIREYFDRIEADEELKEKTKNYIREKISLESGKSERNILKRLSLAALPIAACLVILIGGYTYYKIPVNYVSLDINPSVELGLNRFDRVVEAEGVNSDGNKLLNTVGIMNLSADDAIEKLALSAEENGFIKEDGSSVIAVTALSEQKEKAENLIDQIDGSLRDLIAKGVLHAVIYTDTADLQLRTEAREHGLSSGKYKMILILQSLDPNIGIEQYRNAKITNMLQKANELSQQKGSGGSEGNPEQEQTRNSSDSQIQVIRPNDGSAGQEQNLAPYQNQDQDQVQSQSGKTSPSSVEAEQSQTENQGQDKMTDQPAEGQEQSNQSQSSGGQGGNQNNKQYPN